eukprot:2276996-Amphidinium_carterae.1
MCIRDRSWRSGTVDGASEDHRQSGHPVRGLRHLGPFGHRIQKKAKLHGVRISNDGRITQVELLGPKTAADWASCFAVFRTGAIMLDIISPSRLDGDRDIVVLRQARHYGELVWPLLYQREVRALGWNSLRGSGGTQPLSSLGPLTPGGHGSMCITDYQKTRYSGKRNSTIQLCWH